VRTRKYGFTSPSPLPGGSIAVRHSGAADLRERVIEATYEIMDEAPRTLAKIERWKGIELTPPQREAYAAAALELKDTRAIRPAQLLTPRRPEDRRSDLWTTASVVQEHRNRFGVGSAQGRAGSAAVTPQRVLMAPRWCSLDAYGRATGTARMVEPPDPAPDRITHASLRHGLTHRGEDPPGASRRGAVHRRTATQ
jgi:hypothetical protein